MPFELDHVFLCSAEWEAAERVLSEFGLNLSVRSVHAGQGTASTSALFDNAYLELPFSHDESELLSAPVRPVVLWERLR